MTPNTILEKKPITKEEVEQIIQDRAYTLFDAGFQNDFDSDGNPEEWCFLDMSLEEAKEYIEAETSWFIATTEDGMKYIVGENEISGFGWASEKLD